MSRILNTALAAIFSGFLLGSFAIPANAESIERSYGFNNKKTAVKNTRGKNKTRSRGFNFFDVFSSRKRKKTPQRVAINAKPAVKNLNYTYRANRLVRLGDGRLKQPLKQIVPLFSATGPKGFNPTSNLTGSGKLDDSLAQTIFEVLKAASLSTKVTQKQKQDIVAFYKARSFKSVWTDMDGISSKGKQLLAYLAMSGSDGLNAVDYLPAGLTGFNDDLAVVESDLELIAQLDINLTAMTVRYGQHASGGRIVPNRLSGYHDLAPPKIASSKIIAAVTKANNPESYLASLHPSHKSYGAFKSALASLDNQAPEKSFAHIPTGGSIKLHRSDERILLIRKRLQDTGLLAKPVEEDTSAKAQLSYYDDALFDAVKEFQKSKGLSADGIVGRRTFAAFNGRKKVNKRNLLVMNMERMRWLPRDFGNKHVFVNQASFKLEVMNNNRQVWQTRIVVGKPKNQTSFFIDKMETVVFNPYWGVPQSIITKEMLPRLQANPGYLDQRGFEVYNGRGKKVSSSSIDWYNYGGSRVPFSVRQPPGTRNALGRIKFLFPNKHAIYLHDTPSKHLFARSSRAYSHGCVRVKNPLKFAENILGWSRSRIDDKIAAGKNRSVRLKNSIPVYLTYFTAWADQQGNVSYFGDVYGRDRRLDRALNLITVASN